ncbi:unnamed protein product [Ostreobium quekettii]|uniref:Impact N-terminal domain-containing protein n=1 Tax=Ostreobium quekettii TaxID=121088 RepID=A0A8S1J5R5_9CHLO|nr:unnamed protein product [Ostreobium quekettii]|eukprot:evm.model.scf_1213.7 EVM.evm.TU.scf_1213.7   scf_1213:42573-46556(+)
MVKKSKFIATAWPVDSSQEALALVKQHGDPSASHNCFAYKIGNEFRSSDDGEPGGTAGRPMLAAVEAEGLCHLCVMVTRYFGGIKLGAGGLARAYGGAARMCLKAAQRQFVNPKAEIELKVGYGALGAVYTALQKCDAQRLDEMFGAGGVVTLRISVAASQAEELSSKISNATRGHAVLRRTK